MVKLGFDDPSLHRRYWVSQFLDVGEIPDDEVIDTLFHLRPVEEMLEALRSEEPEVRSRATQMLSQLWLREAGELAYDEILEGIELTEKEALQEALDCFNGLLENYPDFTEAYVRRAALFLQMGLDKAAARDAIAALRQNPHHFGAWHTLGRAYIRLGRFEKAIVALRQAARIQPYAREHLDRIAYCRGRLAERAAAASERCAKDRRDGC